MSQAGPQTCRVIINYYLYYVFTISLWEGWRQTRVTCFFLTMINNHFIMGGSRQAGPQHFGAIVQHSVCMCLRFSIFPMGGWLQVGLQHLGTIINYCVYHALLVYYFTMGGMAAGHLGP